MSWAWTERKADCRKAIEARTQSVQRENAAYRTQVASDSVPGLLPRQIEVKLTRGNREAGHVLWAPRWKMDGRGLEQSRECGAMSARERSAPVPEMPRVVRTPTGPPTTPAAGRGVGRQGTQSARVRPASVVVATLAARVARATGALPGHLPRLLPCGVTALPVPARGRSPRSSAFCARDVVVHPSPASERSCENTDRGEKPALQQAG